MAAIAQDDMKTMPADANAVCNRCGEGLRASDSIMAAIRAGVCDHGNGCGGQFEELMSATERELIQRTMKRLSAILDNTVHLSDSNRQEMRAIVNELERSTILNPYPRRVDKATRRSDMDPTAILEVMRQEDGDVIVQIRVDDPTANGSGVRIRAAVEFCTGQGGGRSPNVHRALCELAVAMDMDQLARPDP